MRRIAAPALLAGIALTAGSVLLTASPAVADFDLPSGHWGSAKPVSLAGIGGVTGEIEKMSCPASGSCTATGLLHDSADHEHVFVVSEKNGTWGKAIRVPGLDALNKGRFLAVTAISCAIPGDCALGGAYSTGDDGDSEPFVADSVNGRWGAAHALANVSTGVNEFTAVVTSISCSEPRDCSAGVTLPSIDSSSRAIPVAFVANETDGTWSSPQAIPPVPNLHAPSSVTSIDCWEAGNCRAGGFATDASGHQHALLVFENAGSWSSSQEVPGITAISGYDSSEDAAVQTVSCTRAVCVVGGTYHDTSAHRQDFVGEFENDGTFVSRTVPGSLQLNHGGVTFPLVACGSGGDCTFGSTFASATGSTGVLLATETQDTRTWSDAKSLAGLGTSPDANEVTLTCGGLGSCVSGGLYQLDTPGQFVAYLADETRGVWGHARRIAANLDAGNSSATLAADCASTGNCAAGGRYTDANGHQLPFVVDESTVTGTSVSLSSAKVAYGREQSMRVTITVTPRTGGTPTGTVGVSATLSAPNTFGLCTASLAGRTASCAPRPTRLSPGSYLINGGYPGDRTYDGSEASTSTLTITPEPTSASLTLSAASIKVGHEGAEHLTVRIKPQTNGTPSGKVTITAGSVRLCQISLAKAKASCTLAGANLKPGSYKLVATYPGVSPYAGSTSAAKTLKVTG